MIRRITELCCIRSFFSQKVVKKAWKGKQAAFRFLRFMNLETSSNKITRSFIAMCTAMEDGKHLEMLSPVFWS